jgi:hypothetical protein
MKAAGCRVLFRDGRVSDKEDGVKREKKYLSVGENHVDIIVRRHCARWIILLVEEDST